jgi:fatty acid desaturase|tara:strand:- start:302 stop:1225 length:924 start_codon:yes stop_codon:yes gene_type:complete
MSDLQRPGDFFSPTEIAYLRTVSSWRSTLAIVHCWGVILGAWIVASVWTNPLTVILAIMIVGARQLGLFVLTHDGAHGALYANRKVNDWVCEWVLNRPFTDEKIDTYRKYHVQHHVNTQQEDDPDLALSKPFPISKSSFRRKVIRDLTGQTGLDQYGRIVRAAFKGDNLSQRLANARRRIGPNVVINLLFLAGFAAAGVWYMYFLLWWVPALTWNRFVVRLRNIGEHAVVPDNDDRLRNTRTTIASWWERALIAPYNVQYHLEHHLVVNCPQYKLKDAHKMLIEKGFEDQMEIQKGYKAILALAVPN